MFPKQWMSGNAGDSFARSEAGWRDMGQSFEERTDPRGGDELGSRRTKWHDLMTGHARAQMDQQTMNRKQAEVFTAAWKRFSHVAW